MNKIKVLILIMIMAIGFNYNVANQTSAAYVSVNTESPKQVVQEKTYQRVNSLDMVAKPNLYLNKNVTVNAKFDKFSTLGLDYKPAMRSSENYITFLIQRDDIKDHNIPLSEMKIFIKRAEAEKHIDLNSGDEIQFSGKVFSTALGDVWMDVDNFKVISSKSTKTQKK